MDATSNSLRNRTNACRGAPMKVRTDLEVAPAPLLYPCQLRLPVRLGGIFLQPISAGWARAAERRLNRLIPRRATESDIRLQRSYNRNIRCSSLLCSPAPVMTRRMERARPKDEPEI